MAEILQTLSSTGSGTGPDFTSIVTWESQGLDLVSAGDTMVLDGYKGTTVNGNWQADGSLAETLLLDGWVTSLTNDITIRAAAGNEHGGDTGEGFRIKVTTPSFTPLIKVVETVNAQLTGLNLYDTNTGNAVAALEVNTCQISRCILRCDGTSDDTALKVRSPADNNTTIENCLFWNSQNGAMTNDRVGAVYRNCIAINCTNAGFRGASAGGDDNTPVLINCVAYNCGTDFDDRGNQWGLGTTNNASEDATAPGANPVTGISAVDFEADGVTPKVGGLLDGAINPGIDLSQFFTDDITGYTRPDPASWERGAYEAQEAPAGVEFIGPDVAAMNGTENVDFGSQPGDMNDRFTGASSYALQAGTLPAGLSVNASTGNIEGTPDPATAGSYPGIIVRGSAAVVQGLTVGNTGDNYGYDAGGYGTLNPDVVDGTVVNQLFANNVSGLVTLATVGNVALFNSAYVALTVDGAPNNPYQLDSLLAPTPYGLYQATYADLANYFATNLGNTLNGSIVPVDVGPEYGRWDAASITFAESVGGGITVDEYQINTVTDGTSTVKSDIGHVTGVHYFEIVCKGTIANAMVGMSDGSAHNGFPGSSAGSLAYWSKNGQIRESGANLGGHPTIPQTTTSVYGVIVDIDAATISWFVDGVAGPQDWSLSLIAAEAGGISNLRPAVGNGSTTDTYEYRINAGQETFAHPENIPDGCHLGWGIDVPVKAAPTTNPVIQQNQWQDFAVGGTTGTLTYGVTPTAGNLLISALTVDKESGPITWPADWTLIGTTETDKTVSGALAYKISDGTEGAVGWTWTNSRTSHVIWISEYSGVTELDVNAEANSADADVTSQTTGTTAANTVDGSLAVAIWGADTSNNVSTSQAYSNGFTQLHPFDPGALAGMAIATKILTGTAAVESTFSAVDSGDAMYGKVAVFK